MNLIPLLFHWPLSSSDTFVLPGTVARKQWLSWDPAPWVGKDHKYVNVTSFVPRAKETPLSCINIRNQLNTGVETKSAKTLLTPPCDSDAQRADWRRRWCPSRPRRSTAARPQRSHAAWRTKRLGKKKAWSHFVCHDPLISENVSLGNHIPESGCQVGGVHVLPPQAGFSTNHKLLLCLSSCCEMWHSMRSRNGTAPQHLVQKISFKSGIFWKQNSPTCSFNRLRRISTAVTGNDMTRHACFWSQT